MNLTGIRQKIAAGQRLDHVDEALLVELHTALEQLFAVGIPTQSPVQAGCAHRVHDMMYGTPELNLPARAATDGIITEDTEHGGHDHRK